jgi:hypothetical protein
MSKKPPKISATRSPQPGSPRTTAPRTQCVKSIDHGSGFTRHHHRDRDLRGAYFWAKSQDGISLSAALGGTPHPSGDLPSVGAWTLTGRAAVPTFGRMGEQ